MAQIIEQTQQTFLECANAPVAIRDTPEYQQMDAYNSCGIIEGFVEAETKAEIAAAWQYAYDHPSVAAILAGSLNQNFGWMIEKGLIDE
jgi:hypothetical protein